MSGTEETRRELRNPVPGIGETGRTIEARVHAVGSSSLKTISIRGFRLNSGEGGHVAGFDLGPGADEHFLGALGASIAQAVSTVSCSYALHVDRIDVTAKAAISPETTPGHFLTIDARVRLESSDSPAAFDGIASEVLARSVIASAIRVPIDVTIDVVAIDPERFAADDWQI